MKMKRSQARPTGLPAGQEHVHVAAGRPASVGRGDPPSQNGTADQITVATATDAEAQRIWTEAADTEARNALQVILSGSEMLLDNIFGRLSPVQKEMLEKMLASAHHLNGIITPLSNSCEFVVDDAIPSAYLRSARAVLEKA